ncbi:MAG: hypothetical protein ABIP97_03515 [Chthoniobacterales bacterium]
MYIFLKFLPSILSKLAAATLMFVFWWPMRKQIYGKSIPWLIGIFTVSFILSSVAYPTYTRYLTQILHEAPASHPFMLGVIFWTVAVCDSFFLLVVVILILSDIAGFIPGGYQESSPLHRLLAATYSHIIPMGIALLALRILPLLVIFYCTSILKSAI